MIKERYVLQRHMRVNTKPRIKIKIEWSPMY